MRSGMALTIEQLLPRLLAAVAEQPASLDEHLELHGPPPDLRRADPRQLIAEVEASGLRGHGGAAFPVARKMRAVASRRGPAIVLANAAEGEPASKKDRVLISRLPHLVLDGAAVAARATGAREVILAVPARAQRSLRSLEFALIERHQARLPGEPRFELHPIHERYISGQETALVDAVNGGPGKPTFTPPRPFERGARRRPTLVQNVETLAHVALIARHGADWFRQLGTREHPGTALVTISGALSAPGVYEIEHGTLLADLLELAGAAGGLRAILLGGYFGSWIDAADAPYARLANEHLAGYGATLGAGVIVALGRDACPVAETSRVADFLAGESAGQCGPCVHGLDSIAYTVHALATGTAGPGAQADLDRWLRELPRRGACQHPDGAVRFIESALRVFAQEFYEHAEHGPCPACSRRSVLPTRANVSLAR
jgi:NADH:ubiquinone oxidoreductase subunit F (NADH-binding)